MNYEQYTEKGLESKFQTQKEIVEFLMTGALTPKRIDELYTAVCELKDIQSEINNRLSNNS